jgi:hypothetical protein
VGFCNGSEMRRGGTGNMTTAVFSIPFKISGKAAQLNHTSENPLKKLRGPFKKFGQRKSAAAVVGSSEGNPNSRDGWLSSHGKNWIRIITALILLLDALEGSRNRRLYPLRVQRIRFIGNSIIILKPLSVDRLAPLKK